MADFGATDYLENKWLDHTLRNVAFTSPTTVYMALFRSEDNTDEVSGGAYARQSITFAAAANGEVSNSVAVTFPAATANWGDIRSAGIYDASSAGNELFHGLLDEIRRVLNGATLSFAIGALVVEVD